jgi:homoserine dehydrogenase
MMAKPVYVGLLGLGNVGGGAVKILQENGALIEQKLGRPVVLKKIAEPNREKARLFDLDKSLLTGSADEVLEDKDIEIIIEAIGGVSPARDYILQALEVGKHVVTSNKEVLAKHGREFYEMARAKKTYLLCEGSVAGGIPILRPLRTALSADEIIEVFGIINGTTNFILSRMTESGAHFDEVLAEAQSLGIAEADPDNDLSGRDAAYKAAILAMHAFKTQVDLNDIVFEGIKKIEKQDISYARELGFAIKLLAVLRREGREQISVNVRPVLVPETHQLAKVSGHFNAVYVRGNAVGEVMFYGLGAGALPTGSAVVSDVLEIASLLDKDYEPRVLPFTGVKLQIKSAGECSGQFYLRLWVADQAGVLEKIAGVFARNQVSIAAVVQKAVVGNNAELVVITHSVKQKNIEQAVADLEKLPTTAAIKNTLRVGI